jgi:uncharacterized protein (TIGR01777 family)
MTKSVHEFRLELPDPADVVFDWHRRPGALARLLPPWQPVRIEHESDSLREGSAVLRLPAGRRWVAEHLRGEYVEGLRFADRLASRPFVLPLTWHHRHDVEPRDRGCVLVDRVTTLLPASVLRGMFGYRHRQLVDDLAAHRATADLPRLTIAVTGSSGLVGSALVPFLTTGGHRVIRLVRRPPGAPDERRWDPASPDPAMLAGVDAVVHLAGEPIAGRFTAEHKDRIRSSRIEPTRLLARAAASASVPVFASASAIGIYGATRGDELLDESSGVGDGFLADVVRDWEEAAASGAAAESATRVVLVRTGIVQSPRGGALRLQRPLFAAGLGGPMGGGRQWLSWIGIDDLVDVYLRAITDPELRGPVNAVAPNPVRQRDYARALGRVLHVPAVLPTPRLGPRLLLGREGEREVASASQRVVPARLLAAGHAFRFPHIEPALGHLLRGSAEP